VWDRLRAIQARTILLASLAAFLIYAWPGFVGWDTREHFLQSRAGVYTDGHPPAVAYLVRLCEVFVAGPALLLLIQAITLLVGLYMILRTRLTDRVAALAASGVFLFPYVSGVTGLIAKDGLMAGFLAIAIGLMLDERTSRQRWALVFLLLASLMRWNALAATFVPMLLLFRWKPSLTGVRRYAIALVVWLGVTAAAYETNDLLTTKHEFLWYWSFAYEDIGGTLANMPAMDDPTMEHLLEGLPLLYHDHLYDRFKAIYNPASHYHLMRDPGRLLEIPRDQAERDATAAAWKRCVLGNPGAYLKYRIDNFRQLMMIDRPPSFSNVYVWFNVIAAPEVITELQHDATAGRIQDRLIRGSKWISLTPLYYTFVYFALTILLLPFVRRRLEASLLLSAIGYELQWFFLAATADVRYSQWMVICTLTTAALLGLRRWQRT
jgi:hypothetical protein